MNDTTELYAWIALPPQKKDNSRFEVPIIRDGNVITHEMRGPAEFLRIFVKDGAFRLETFDSKGRGMGDYWFENVEDAKHQAAYLYGSYLSEWHQVPATITNVIDFILNRRQLRGN